jgi:hypothetical protein
VIDSSVTPSCPPVDSARDRRQAQQLTPSSSPREERIRGQVRLVLYSPQRERLLPERRREWRQPFPYPVHLTPVDPDGKRLVDEMQVVIGKHLSELGFDFYHYQPLPQRRAVVSFELSPDNWTALLIDLTWCRFSRHGLYDSGGKFLEVTQPLSPPAV